MPKTPKKRKSEIAERMKPKKKYKWVIEFQFLRYLTEAEAEFALLWFKEVVLAHDIKCKNLRIREATL